MKATLIAVLVLALGGAGYYGWQTTRDLEETKRQLAASQAEAAQARAQAAASKKDAEAARAELVEQKAAAEKLRIDLAAAASFLEQEKALGMRLRDELAMMKEKMALMLASRNRGLPEVRPMAITPQPMIIRAAPRGVAASAARQAAPPQAGDEPPR